MLKSFGKLFMENNMGFVGVIIATFSLISCAVPVNEDEEKKPSTIQESKGNNSPNVTANGNVNIIYSSDIQKREIYKILTSLDKVESLLPIDINLQNCMESERENLLKIDQLSERMFAESTNYSRCLLLMKQEFKSPEWMILQHSPLLMELSEQKPEIETLVGEIIFAIREMQNNQHQHEIWSVLGCSDEVKYVEGLVVEKYEGSCLFVIEDIDMYKDRIEKTISGEVTQTSNDIFSQIGKTKLENVNIKVAVVPRSQDVSNIGKVIAYDTMVGQTVDLNEKVFYDMEKSLSKLRTILSSFVEK